MEMSQLICGGCCTLLMYAHGATSVRCSCCHTVNLAPAHNIAHVNCGNCCTTLMYPYGAPSVKCSVCQYITNVNMGNVRVPIAMLRSNGATSSASMPSSSADLPNSQSQTVVVENPMSVDKSGKLALSVLQWIKNDLWIVAVLESKEQFMMLSSVGTSGIEMRFCILREKVSYWPCYFLVLLLYFLMEMLKEL